MTTNTSCFYTPPLSPASMTINKTEHTNFKKEKVNGCVYPSYKRKQPHNLKIKTSNLSNNNKIVGGTHATSLYQKINETSVSKPQETNHQGKVNSPTPLSKQYMERVMENTNLICSFLKTVCVGIPIDENNECNGLPSPKENEEIGNKKARYVSLENFVATILIRTNLTDTFVYVALLYIHRYLNYKKKLEEVKRRNAIALMKNGSVSTEITNKKCVYLPKGLASKMSNRTRSRHSISKGNHKIKLSQQSINYIYQQSKKARKDENKKKDNIVVSKSFDFSKESLIKTQKDLIFAAMICSSKYLDDNSYCNTAWVKLTDKSLKEVLDLEREFLVTLQYKLYFNHEEWKEWFVWISHFKSLLDVGVTTNEDKSSPSCMISVPSQSSSAIPYYRYGQAYPSPIEISTPTSAISPSGIPITYNEEEMEEEKFLLNYPSNNHNIFLPSLSALASFDEYAHQERMLRQFYVSQYAMRYSKSSSQYCYPCYPVTPQYLKSKMERSIPYEALMDGRKGAYLPCPSVNKSCHRLIDTSLINQAQNNKVDFSEIQELSQKLNFIFKKPVLPPLYRY